MKLPGTATEVKSDFTYDYDPDQGTLVIWKDGKEFVLTYWECILLNRILTRNLI